MFSIQAFTFNPFQENTYILFNEQKECIIIDPGTFFPEEKETLAKYIKDNDLTPKLLLNTHCHLDHIFGNKYFTEAYYLKLQMHALDESTMQNAIQSGERFGLKFDNYEGEKIFLKEGDSVELGADKLDVLFVPGHAPGHIAFYCAAQDFVIGGDVLFKHSIGRTDLPGCNHEDLIQSIKTKLFTLPDKTTVFPGHGGPTTIEEEKKNNPFVRSED